MTTPTPVQQQMSAQQIQTWLASATHEQRMEYYASQTAKSTATAASILTFLMILTLVGVAVSIAAATGAFSN